MVTLLDFICFWIPGWVFVISWAVTRHMGMGFVGALMSVAVGFCAGIGFFWVMRRMRIRVIPPLDFDMHPVGSSLWLSGMCGVSLLCGWLSITYHQWAER